MKPEYFSVSNSEATTSATSQNVSNARNTLLLNSSLKTNLRVVFLVSNLSGFDLLSLKKWHR